MNMVCKVESCLGEATLQKNFNAFDITELRFVDKISLGGRGNGTHLKRVDLTRNWRSERRREKGLTWRKRRKRSL